MAPPPEAGLRHAKKAKASTRWGTAGGALPFWGRNSITDAAGNPEIGQEFFGSADDGGLGREATARGQRIVALRTVSQAGRDHPRVCAFSTHRPLRRRQDIPDGWRPDDAHPLTVRPTPR